MRLNIIRLMRSTLPLAAVLLLTACAHTANYTIGGAVTGLNGSGLTSYVVLQDNGGDNLTVSANGAFTFATTVTSCGAIGSANCGAYNVTVLTQPLGQICTVTGGSGTATGNVTGVAVNCTNTTAPRNAYVANAGSNDVSEYTINSNGTLTLTTTIGAGTNPFSVTVDPLSQYVYVANEGGYNISQYTINSDGTLTAMSPPTVLAATNPYSITVSPSGRYAYVANEGDGTVSQYTIGTLSSLTPGALTQMSPPTVLAGTNPYSITVSPSGRYAYVANEGDGTVSQYTIGTLSSLTPGALTAMSTPTVLAGTNPASVTVSNSGQYAYVANYGSNTVSQYTIGTGGALTAMATATVAAGTNPYSVTVDPSGRYVYVANEGGYNVSQYTIVGGALTPIATATTVAAGTNPISVITAQ